ncbi:MAG TPA: endonuclease/exonuclease/phosphatase family protein [Polyangiaceae bacterium]|jgi:endonuclease/exonuclease/phosphatase family metal-dependent hydrolase
MAFVLATFNVLDLFDASDPGRIARIAAVLRPHAPDVIALQEVGSNEAVRAIADALGGGFTHVIGDADARGIRNALLARVPIVESMVLRAPHLGFPRFIREDPEPFEARIPLRRPIPDVVVDAGALGRVRIMVVHFKSRRGTPMREPSGATIPPLTTAELAASEARAVTWRCAEALFVRRAVDDRLARNPDEHLVVCGDFNDVPGSLPLRIVAGTAGGDLPRPDRLTSTVDTMPPAERFSVNHDDEPAAIDHALLSPALAKRLERAFYERSSLNVASDHAPLIARFI